MCIYYMNEIFIYFQLLFIIEKGSLSLSLNMDSLSLVARKEAMDWARQVSRKFEIRDVDKSHTHAVFTEIALFEQPRPLLEVSAKRVGDIYTITVRGYSGTVDIKRWCEIFLHGERHELLRRVTWAGAQLTAKEIALVLYMDSADATIASSSANKMDRATINPEPAVRVHAVDFASNLVKTMNVREFDRQWVEAVLVEAIMFEQPQPTLEITLDPVGELYNITVHGYKGFVDLRRWCNKFLGKSRDKFLNHLVHTWLQVVPERGPCIVLQMERNEFQTASAEPEAMFAEPVPPFRERSRHRSKTPQVAHHSHRSRSRSRSKKRTE